MGGVNLATPLYGVYAARFGFSSLVLTLVFALYAIVLVPSLLLFGRLSDRFGRRPVILAGMVAAGVSLGLFAGATSTAWLFAARAGQGLAVGMISGAATAALVELDPLSGGQRPAMLAGLAQAGGSGFGPLVAGVLAEWGPAPRQLSYLVMLVVTAIAAAFLFTVPEPARHGHEPWRIQWPRVPADIRGDFVRVSVTAATVWGSAAMYLSIVPSYVSDLLDTDNLALFGALGALALAASCVAQLIATRWHASRPARQAAGLAVLGAGLVALVVAAPLRSLPLLLISALAVGAGHGIGFINAQDELNAIAPPERRGEVTAAFICCIYVVVASSVIASGLLDLHWSLPASVGTVAVVLALIASGTATWQLVVARLRSRAPSAARTGR